MSLLALLPQILGGLGALNSGDLLGAAGYGMNMAAGGQQEASRRETTDQNMNVNGVPTPVLPEYAGPAAPPPQPSLASQLLQIYFGLRGLQ